MSEQFVDLDAVFNYAAIKTEELMKLGFDISDPSVVTELGWVANKYPEIVERCNNALLELIDKQAKEFPAIVTTYSDERIGEF